MFEIPDDDHLFVDESLGFAEDIGPGPVYTGAHNTWLHKSGKTTAASKAKRNTDDVSPHVDRKRCRVLSEINRYQTGASEYVQQQLTIGTSPSSAAAEGGALVESHRGRTPDDWSEKNSWGPDSQTGGPAIGSALVDSHRARPSDASPGENSPRSDLGRSAVDSALVDSHRAKPPDAKPGGSSPQSHSLMAGPDPKTGTCKRSFPGPAGILPMSQTLSQAGGAVGADRSPVIGVEQVPAALKERHKPARSSVDVFAGGGWQALLADLQPLGEDLLSAFSLQLMLHKARRRLLPKGKVPLLVVVVDTVDLQGVDAGVVVRDPSGVVEGTLHRDLLRDFGADLQVGAAMVLRQVSLVSLSAHTHYLNITAANIVVIYPANNPAHTVYPASSAGEGVDVEKRCAQGQQFTQDLLRSHILAARTELLQAATCAREKIVRHSRGSLGGVASPSTPTGYLTPRPLYRTVMSSHRQPQGTASHTQWPDGADQPQAGAGCRTPITPPLLHAYTPHTLPNGRGVYTASTPHTLPNGRGVYTASSPHTLPNGRGVYTASSPHTLPNGPGVYTASSPHHAGNSARPHLSHASRCARDGQMGSPALPAALHNTADPRRASRWARSTGDVTSVSQAVCTVTAALNKQTAPGSVPTVASFTYATRVSGPSVSGTWSPVAQQVSLTSQPSPSPVTFSSSAPGVNRTRSDCVSNCNTHHSRWAFKQKTSHTLSQNGVTLTQDDLNMHDLQVTASVQACRSGTADMSIPQTVMSVTAGNSTVVTSSVVVSNSSMSGQGQSVTSITLSTPSVTDRAKSLWSEELSDDILSQLSDDF